MGLEVKQLRLKRKAWIVGIWLALCLVYVVGCTPVASNGQPPAVTPEQLIVHVIDVGQADSILVQFPSGQNLLIDGGNNGDGELVANCLRGAGVQRLDFVIGTHPHEDHIGGLDEVIKAFPVGQVYLPKVTQNTKSYSDLLQCIQDKGLKVTEAKAGMTLAVGTGVTASLLAPLRDDYQELNDWSVVLRVVYGQVSLLFAGDAGPAAESDLVNSGQTLQADVLKVGHHGSATSSSAAFLKLVQPRYAIISVAKQNDYGHPSSATLKRLQNIGAKVYRTDQSGTVVFSTDGQSVQFEQDSSSGQGVTISSVDRKAEVVSLQNGSAAGIDISGWTLVSEVGNQRFTFPTGTKLAAGATLRITSGSMAKASLGTLVWSQENIWNNEGDPAVLLNAQGQQVSRVDR